MPALLVPLAICCCCVDVVCVSAASSGIVGMDGASATAVDDRIGDREGEVVAPPPASSSSKDCEYEFLRLSLALLAAMTPLRSPATGEDGALGGGVSSSSSKLSLDCSKSLSLMTEDAVGVVSDRARPGEGGGDSFAAVLSGELGATGLDWDAIVFSRGGGEGDGRERLADTSGGNSFSPFGVCWAEAATVALGLTS